MNPLQIDGKWTKDSVTGEKIVLTGVNYDRFIDGGNGDWQDLNGDYIWNTWDEAHVHENIHAMGSWGINCVRVLATAEWWISDTHGHQQHLKDFIALAGSHNIYVDYGFWRVAGVSDQADLPFPPHNEGASDTAIIANEAAFVALWSDVANKLKGYNNILFELWNEPASDAQADWFPVVQDCIDAIRATSATQPIVVQWGVCLGLDYDNWEVGSIWGIDWIDDNPLTDTANNILYSTHCYRSSFYNWPITGLALTTADMNWCFDDARLAIANCPHALWIGEISGNLWGVVADELTWYHNTLEILNGLYFGYCGWDWFRTGTAWGHLELNGDDFAPSNLGTVLQGGITDKPDFPPEYMMKWVFKSGA